MGYWQVQYTLKWTKISRNGLLAGPVHSKPGKNMVECDTGRYSNTLKRAKIWRKGYWQVQYTLNRANIWWNVLLAGTVYSKMGKNMVEWATGRYSIL
jgi:hypothetical protein